MKWISRGALIGVLGGTLGLLCLVHSAFAGSHKDFPERSSDIYMPVSLAEGTVRTLEFPVVPRWYSILIQIEQKRLPSQEMRCMLGVTLGPLDAKDCSSNAPLLRADWTVWDGERIVDQGSIPDNCGCSFSPKYIHKLIGSFAGEAGKKYVVEVKFTKDGSPLNVAAPHLIVIQHEKFW